MRRIDPDRLLRDVGRRLAELRSEKGATQEAFAAEAGLSTRYVQRVEAGEENLTLRSLAILASVLRSPVATLLEPPRTRTTRKGRPPKRVPSL